MAIEEQIIAFAAFIEMMHKIIHGDLNIICYGIDGIVAVRHDIEFSEADARTCGNIEFDTVFLTNGQTNELIRIEGQMFIQLAEADDLHVRMAQGAAGHRPVIFEEQYGFIFSGVLHPQPMVDAKVEKAMQVLCGIVRDVLIAMAAFDEDELICIFKYVVLVLEQDDVAVRVDDIREMRAIAEGTGSLVIDDVFWFFLA